MFLAVANQDSQTSLLNSVVQQEMAQRRQRVGISRQDSRLSVKSLIESIEKTSHVKSNGQNGSQCSSSSSINSLMSDQLMQTTRNPNGEWSDSGNISVDQSTVIELYFCGFLSKIGQKLANYYFWHIFRCIHQQEINLPKNKCKI